MDTDTTTTEFKTARSRRIDRLAEARTLVNIVRTALELAHGSKDVLLEDVDIMRLSIGLERASRIVDKEIARIGAADTRARLTEVAASAAAEAKHMRAAKVARSRVRK